MSIIIPKNIPNKTTHPTMTMPVLEVSQAEWDYIAAGQWHAFGPLGIIRGHKPALGLVAVVIVRKLKRGVPKHWADNQSDIAPPGLSKTLMGTALLCGCAEYKRPKTDGESYESFAALSMRWRYQVELIKALATPKQAGYQNPSVVFASTPARDEVAAAAKAAQKKSEQAPREPKPYSVVDACVLAARGAHEKYQKVPGAGANIKIIDAAAKGRPYVYFEGTSVEVRDWLARKAVEEVLITAGHGSMLEVVEAARAVAADTDDSQFHEIRDALKALDRIRRRSTPDTVELEKPPETRNQLELGAP